MKVVTDYLATNPKRVLIFDFDSTLCHLHLPWGEYLAAVGEYCQSKDRALYDELVKDHSITELINAFVERFGQEAWDFDRSYSERFEHQRLTKTSVNHELLGWLEEVGDKYQLAIWSSNCVSTIRKALDESGHRLNFSIVVGKDKVELMKPDPLGFTKIHTELEAKLRLKDSNDSYELEDFLMIGDNESADGGAAAHAGIDYLRVEFRP